MRKSRAIKGLWIWALLAVLLSYSFDFECLLERTGCDQQTAQHQSTQLTVDSSCAQPSLLPTLGLAPVALLPTWTSIEGPTVAITSVAPRLVLSQKVCVPPIPWVPLGLRAPPSSRVFNLV